MKKGRRFLGKGTNKTHIPRKEVRLIDKCLSFIGSNIRRVDTYETHAGSAFCGFYHGADGNDRRNFVWKKS